MNWRHSGLPTRIFRPRATEALLLLAVILFAGLGHEIVVMAAQVRQEANPLPAVPDALLPAAALAASLAAIHWSLLRRRTQGEQLILPLAGLLLALGMIMIGRVRTLDAVWQQIGRGLIPGTLIAVALAAWPNLVELLRRRWVVAVSLAGLGLLAATAFFGVEDESGARLALRIGPLPAVQTSELVKLALIVFLAWYIERTGEEAEGRARPVAWLRLPAAKYFIPGSLYVGMATLALVKMWDFGAIVILGLLFVAMLYAGYETRVFLAIAAVGLVLTALAGAVLAFTWQPPDVAAHRFAAFMDPWSVAPLLVDGQPTGLTVAEGPGYQLQQAIYATIAGGLGGTGLGYGSPQYIPLAHSDFIFVAILEEMGAAVGIAVLIVYAIVLLRMLRVAVLLPRSQKFERLLLVGIALHWFTQVFVMVGGALKVLPLTGVTMPLLSQGGAALIVNMTEIGLVLALAQRLEPTPA